MNIVIPMAGLGTRFTNEGFILPKPLIEINGKKHERSWGKCKFELDAARYDVKIYFPYIFMSECGANTVTINLETGDQKKISYYMWPWMFSKGSISVK